MEGTKSSSPSSWCCLQRVRAAPELGPGVAEVRECAERNFPEHTARQKLVLERSVAGSEARRLEATLLWKRSEGEFSRVRVTVDAPQQERGTAFLLIEREGEDDMFSYLPEYRKVRRITSRAVTGPFLGTDLSYEDFQQLQVRDKDARSRALPTARSTGGPVRAGRQLATAGASAYERVRTYIDRESCVAPRRTVGARRRARGRGAWADRRARGER
jgi:hypothetical protein